MCSQEEEVKFVKEDEEKVPIKKLSVSTNECVVNEEDYNVNIFNITIGTKTDDDFKVQVVLNNNVCLVLADTGAKISVCSRADAEKWNLMDRMINTKVKFKPYGHGTPVITPLGVAKCAATFRSRSVPVDWYIIENSCEPVLASKKAEILGVVSFTPRAEVFSPVNMITKDVDDNVQKTLIQYSDLF